MARLRAESPIHYCADSKFGPYWSVTTYKPIQHVEALPKVFSSSWEYGGITVAGDGVEHLKEGEVPMPMFIAMDLPQHSARSEGHTSEPQSLMRSSYAVFRLK